MGYNRKQILKFTCVQVRRLVKYMNSEADWKIQTQVRTMFSFMARHGGQSPPCRQATSSDEEL